MFERLRRDGNRPSGFRGKTSQVLGGTMLAVAAGAVGYGVATVQHNATEHSTGSFEGDITELHNDAVAKCVKFALDAFGREYPVVTVSKEPTAQELEDALKAVKARDAEGKGFVEGQFADCMDPNFDSVVTPLVDMPFPADKLPGATATSVPTETVTSTEG